MGTRLHRPSPHYPPSQQGPVGVWASACPLPLFQLCSSGLSSLAVWGPAALGIGVRGGPVCSSSGSWRRRGAEAGGRAGGQRACRPSGQAGWAGGVPSPSELPCKASTFFSSALPPRSSLLGPPGQGLRRHVGSRLTTAAPGGAGRPCSPCVPTPPPASNTLLPWPAGCRGVGPGAAPPSLAPP